MKRHLKPFTLAVLVSSVLIASCEKHGPVSAEPHEKEAKPGLPQLPPEQGGAKGAANAGGPATGGGPGGTRSDYQPSTGPK